MDTSAHGEGESPEGRLTETVGITVFDDADRELLMLIVDPKSDGWVVQLDEGARDDPAGGRFDQIDTTRDGCVLISIGTPGGDPPKAEVIELRPRR